MKEPGKTEIRQAEFLAVGEACKVYIMFLKALDSQQRKWGWVGLHFCIHGAPSGEGAGGRKRERVGGRLGEGEVGGRKTEGERHTKKKSETLSSFSFYLRHWFNKTVNHTAAPHSKKVMY